AARRGRRSRARWASRGAWPLGVAGPGVGGAARRSGQPWGLCGPWRQACRRGAAAASGGRRSRGRRGCGRWWWGIRPPPTAPPRGVAAAPIPPRYQWVLSYFILRNRSPGVALTTRDSVAGCSASRAALRRPSSLLVDRHGECCFRLADARPRALPLPGHEVDAPDDDGPAGTVPAGPSPFLSWLRHRPAARRSPAPRTR